MNKTQYYLVVALLLVFVAMPVSAGDAVSKTVAALVKDKVSLKGKQVMLSGKVIKVNNGIMKRNFIHLDDGTSQGDVKKVIVTSQQTAKVGQKVSVTGTVVLDTDFGFGYSYPLLVEKSVITVK